MSVVEVVREVAALRDVLRDLRTGSASKATRVHPRRRRAADVRSATTRSSLKLHTRAARCTSWESRPHGGARHGSCSGRGYLEPRLEYLQVKTLGPDEGMRGPASTRRGLRRARGAPRALGGQPVPAHGQAPLMPLTVGTAGHIDHGKTWLVRALTGKDTDRLPGGAAARDLDRPRLRAARAPRRAAALGRRRSRARALRADDGRRRDRDRPLPPRDRRGGGRAPADARAPRDPAPARDRARRRRAHEGRRGRRGDGRARRGGGTRARARTSRSCA